MKMTNVLLVVGLLGFVAAGPCFAQGDAKKAEPAKATEGIKAERDDAIALGRELTQSLRQSIVAVNLELTSKEAEAFWPVYKAYQDQLTPLRDRAVKLIVSYGEKFETLTDDDAKAMLEELLSINEAESQVRRECLPKFEAALPIKKVARFYQIDNKINAEIRYQLSLEIPLLETTESIGQ